jgi:phosphate transport system protein
MVVHEPLSENLQPLRRALFSLIERAQSSVTHGIAALLTGDRERAKTAMQHEEVSDSHELLVADHAFLALVRFQPMARELRYVLVARDVAHQLERAADQGARLAKLGLKIDDAWRHKAAPELNDLGQVTEEQFKRSVNLLRSFDSENANTVFESDKRIDELHDFLKDRMVSYISHGLGEEGTKQALAVVEATRRLERLGDIAVGLARETVFGATGEVTHGHALESTSERLNRLKDQSS